MKRITAAFIAAFALVSCAPKQYIIQNDQKYTLSKTYLGPVPQGVVLILFCPELRDAEGKVYVRAFLSKSETPDQWVPHHDLLVSWKTGVLIVNQAQFPDNFKVEIFRKN